MEPKLTPKMHLFMTHFQRVKSCESVVNSVQIAFLRIPKKSIDLGAILTPILDPHRHQKCSLYSKAPPWDRKVASENGAGKTVTAGEFCQGGGGEGRRTPETEGGATRFGGHF